MKKILLITSSFQPMPPVKGGAVETLTENYLKYNEQNKKMKFVVYSYGEVSIKGFEKSNTEYRFIKQNKMANILFKILRKINSDMPDYFLYAIKRDLVSKKEKFDCIVIENSPKYVKYVKRCIGDKIILHIHNEWFGKETNEICKKCSRVITVSDYLRKRINKDSNVENVSVVFNAIDEKLFSFSNGHNDKVLDLRKKYGIKETDRVILFTGKIKYEKGALELIRAFKKAKFNNKTKLVMAGTLSEEKKYRKTILSEIEGVNNIILTGYIDYRDLPNMYQMSNIQIIPSQVEDCCPLTAFEGICSGLPQIVSRSGGIPEIVEGAGAIVIERGDSFIDELSSSLKVVKNDEELAKLRKKQLIKAKEYKNEIFCKKMLNEIMEVCNER